jgi:restriction system protein
MELLVPIVFIILLYLCGTYRERAYFGSLLPKVREIVNTHSRALERKRLQTLGKDDFGNIMSNIWVREINYFIDNVVFRLDLNKNERNSLSKHRDKLVSAIYQMVEELKSTTDLGINEVSSGVEFEHYCAQQLNRHGWKTQVTQVTGDQGADVVAHKGNRTLLLQCKYYSTPVGNKAVQEAATARMDRKADFAAVVTNSTYTTAAKKLARTTDVLLLHYSELEKIDATLEDIFPR